VLFHGFNIFIFEKKEIAMDAVLRIQSSEFTDELIEKIKALIRGKENSEITISIVNIHLKASFGKKPVKNILPGWRKELTISRKAT